MSVAFKPITVRKFNDTGIENMLVMDGVRYGEAPCEVNRYPLLLTL